MEEKRLYDVDSIEFNELLDTARIELKNDDLEYQDLEYQDLENQVNEIMDKYPRIHSLFENDEVTNLNEEECKMLQNLISLYLKMSSFEERKIFFLGARENYFYFKNMNLIKE